MLCSEAVFNFQCFSSLWLSDASQGFVITVRSGGGGRRTDQYWGGGGRRTNQYSKDRLVCLEFPRLLL
jgi:hypothetical protein